MQSGAYTDTGWVRILHCHCQLWDPKHPAPHVLLDRDKGDPCFVEWPKAQMFQKCVVSDWRSQALSLGHCE